MSSLGLFQGFGIELEYMIVDRETLRVRSVADDLLFEVTGSYDRDIERGPVTWSNELVCHVLELKTSVPAPALAGLDELLHGNVLDVERLLEPRGARLLPTGAHPFMDPETETRIWPHSNARIYAAYDRIFGCRGHGWSNLQSMHLNLPFQGDEEFGRLHAAVRLILPLLPGLAASSPVLDGRLTGYADTRLETYRHNQHRIPVLTGRVVPEAVFTRSEYEEAIFRPIRMAVAPHDPEGVLSPFFMNSRGAIARFDRGSIEIRVLDLQESPRVDLAVAELVVAVLRALVAERWSGRGEQREAGLDGLAELFLETIRDGEETTVRDPAYLALLGLPEEEARVGEVWRRLAAAVEDDLSPRASEALARILEEGTLSTRIVRALGPEPDRDDVLRVYRELGRCLLDNTVFPCAASS